MHKRSFKLKRIVTKEKINLGDKVKVIDGSSITPMSNDQDCYIVCAYPELTGSQLLLKDMEAEVISTKVRHYACEGVCGNAYRQDLVIKLGLCEFRIASGMVRKIEVEEINEITFERGDRFKSLGSTDEYILSQVAPLSYCLISLNSGNRYSEAIKTKSHKINLNELMLMKDEELNLTKID